MTLDSRWWYVSQHDVQLELDLAGSHEDATTAFREWLLSQPLPDWITEASDDDE